MELLTELKKKEILLYAPTQINFEDIMLCENSHKRANTAWFHSNEVFKAVSHRNRKQKHNCQGLVGVGINI